MQACAASSSPERHAFLFGHSFVSRLSREARKRRRTTLDFVSLSGFCKLSSDGYPGLTYMYNKVFENPAFYLRNLKREPIDILIIDMGTNDLCDLTITPSVLVSKVLQFLDLLRDQGVKFQSVVIFTII